MPFDVTCPDCAKRVEMPDRVRGRRVRCKDCLAEFVAEPGPPKRTREEPDKYSPRPGEEDDEPRGSVWVRLGIVAAVVLVVGGIVAVVAVSRKEKPDEPI